MEEEGEVYVRTTKFPGRLQKEQFIEGGTGSTDHDNPPYVLLLYHYRYKSKKEYEIKRCFRGEVDGVFRGCDPKTKRLVSNEKLQSMKKVHDHIPHRPGTVLDDLAWTILTTKVPKYRLYDDTSNWNDYY